MARTSKGWNSSLPWSAGLWWNRAPTCVTWWAWARTGWARLAAWKTCRGSSSTATHPMGALKVSIQTRDVLMLVVSLTAAVYSLCLYVPAVLYRAWAAVWSFGLSLLVFGVISVVMLARVLHEAS